MDEAGTSVGQLQEDRMALIVAAVTGKIDVRSNNTQALKGDPQ